MINLNGFEAPCMVRRVAACLAVLLLVVVGAPVTGLAADTGQISGTVIDEKTGEAIIGASVLVSGTTLGASCDIDGHYLIRDVPAGTHEVVVSSIGYVQNRITDVTVATGQTVQMDVTIAPTEIEMETIEVTTTRKKTNESAMLVKRRSAPNLTDGLSTEMFRRSGDSDAGQTAKRVVGISVVDGRSLVVRGMGGRYTSVLLNGASLPSPEPEKREVPLDLFPTALLDQVVASKTFTPDQRANFSGGSLNLTTSTFPAGLTYKFSSSASYNSVSTGTSRPSYRGGHLDWLGIDDGTRDVPDELKNTDWWSDDPRQLDTTAQRVAGQSFSDQWTPVKSRTPINTGYSLSLGNRYDLGSGRTLGMLGSLTYNNSYSVHEGEIYREWNNDTIPYVDLSNINRGTQSILWGSLVSTGLTLSDNHKFTLQGMYNRTSDDEAFEGRGHDSYNGVDFYETHLRFVSRWVGSGRMTGEHRLGWLGHSNITWGVGMNGANRYEPDNRTALYSIGHDADGNEFLRYFESGYSFSRIYTDLDDRGANANIDWAVPLSSNGSHLKFGGLFENKTRGFGATRYRYRQGTRGAQNIGLAEDILTEDNIGSWYEKNKWSLINNTFVEDRYDVNDHNTAGYIMADFKPLPRLRTVAGVRYEDGDMLMKTGSRETGTDTLVNLNTADWLPMAGFVYSLSDRANARFVVSRTLGRPEYREIAPFTFQNFGLSTPTTGNPNLRTTYIWNYDLRFEFFPRVGEVIAISGFAKSFTDPIEVFVATSATRSLWQFVNAKSASNIGMEFEVRKSLDMLPGRLSRLTFGGNLALVKSQVEIVKGDGEGTVKVDRPLMGQAPYTVNLMLGYTSAGEGNTDVTLLYNVSGARLYRLTTADQSPYYEQPRPQLDFILNHKIRSTVGLKLSVKNILDSKFLVTQEQLDGRIEGVTEEYGTGRSVSFGVSYGI